MLYTSTQVAGSSRRIYLKIAVLAVLKYQSHGRPLTAREVRDLGQRYIPRNQQWSNQVVGSILGMLSRMKLIDRSYDKPYVYWWENSDI